jgi:hypothetical protein
MPGGPAAAARLRAPRIANMPGLKPRNRLVNFRLTEEEYGRLAAVCARKGSPSISDFARAAILRTIEAEAAREGPPDTLLAALGERLSDLERSFRSLAEPAADGARRNTER